MTTITSFVVRALRAISGWFAFFGLIAEVLFLTLLYLQTILSSDSVTSIVMPKSTEPTPPPEMLEHTRLGFVPPFWLIVLLAVISLAFVIFLIYKMVKTDIPASKDKVEKTVEKVAEKALKQIEKRHKVTKKQEQIITERMVFWMRIVLVVLPLLVVLILQNVTMALSKQAALFGMTCLTAWTVFWLLIARLMSTCEARQRSDVAG